LAILTCCNTFLFLTTINVQGAKEKFLLYRLRVYKDSRAFAQVFQMHKSPVFRYLRIKLPLVQDAEDALSTTFIRLWNYVTTSHVDNLAALSFTIARGVVADFYRSRKHDTSLEVMTEAGVEFSDGQDVGEQVEQKEDLERIKRILPKLREDYQEIIILRHIEGLSTKEVARFIDKTESAVRVALHRALKELRTLLENESHAGQRDHNTSQKSQN
jgi:RNA polymerase sigma-70 factor, ECF subfamily